MSLEQGHVPETPQIIWVTGFSGAGKTTVARKVKHLLSEADVNVVHLDGDDLRAIFSGKWGYERAERIELARAYFRLCGCLAAQGCTVIISAVAMYKEIFEWVEVNLDRPLIVYLRVPDAQRRARDELTKKVYRNLGSMADLYDEPHAPDVMIDNHDSVTAEDAARSIVSAFFSSTAKHISDRGRGSHWQKFYSSTQVISDPSSFCRVVADELRSAESIIEVGCGNGRDASYFASLGHTVYALDPSAAAIQSCSEKLRSPLLHFQCGTLPQLKRNLPSGVDAVYSRFCLHAMTAAEEWETLVSAHALLKSGGRLFIEARSINDPLARKGEIIGPNERIHGHYRRFIVLDELRARLDKIGFEVVHALEAGDLAVFGNDNPVVIRITAQKRQ